MLAALCVVIAYAATRPQDWRPTPPSTPSALTPSEQPTGAMPSDPPDQSDLLSAVASIEQRYHVSIGLAIAPIASPGKVASQPWLGGSLTTGMAWQAITLPIGYAVTIDPRQPSDLAYLLNHSITQGSIAGDQALWQQLGTPDAAAAATGAVLATTGDVTTALPTGTSDSGQAAVFSQLYWAHADAAQFMGVFFCMDSSWPVLTHMTTATANAFGLASLAQSRVVTGYGSGSNTQGPGTSVRQVGILRLRDGSRVGVSLGAYAADGTLATAQTAMTAAALLLPPLTGFDGSC
jgi:hypothetical protein